jgi:primase-polymerase (primpol)-like protein
MNIIEAISSGFPFKREDWCEFYTNSGYKQFDIDDILADDWIIDSGFQNNNQFPLLPTMDATYGF